jgi:hypothetical protein
MNSKLAVRQRLHSVLQILNLALLTVLVIFVLSESSLAQGQLPFTGTRSFCGEHSYQLWSAQRDSDPWFTWKTKTTVTIRANGFTTVKTNAYGPPYQDARRSSPYPLVTLSGKLTPGKANTMEKGEMRPAMAVCGPENCLWFSSANDIEVSSDWGTPDKAALCTSEAAAPKKSNDVQRTSAAAGNARSNSTLGVRPQSTSTQQIAPDTLVANLYRQQERVFQPRSRVLLDKYFERSLADLIWKALLRWESSGDSEIEDFDYVLYNFGQAGNDSTSTKPVTGKPSYEGRKAQVNVSYTTLSAGSPKSMRYKETIIFLLAAGDAGWKITDIKYDGGKTSLFEMYSKEFKETGELPIKKNDSASASLLDPYPAPANPKLQPRQSIKPATPGPPTKTPTSGTPTGDTVNETNVDPAAAELRYWESIRNSMDPEDFKAYLNKYPNGQFVALAKLRAQPARPARNPASADVTAAERARNTHVFEVRDASKTSGWLTVAPGSLTFEPKKPQAGKNMTIQCSDINHIEQGQSAVASPHVNLFFTTVDRKEGPLVFYTSSGGTGVVGVFVKGLPAKPVVNITNNVISAIREACRLNYINQ